MSDTITTIPEAAVANKLPRAITEWPLNAPLPGPRIAVLIPCCNEEATIAKVVGDFHAHLPHASVYVYDNNSSDRSAMMARAAGACVRKEPLQGKGHVVRRMFADVDADIYLLVDGDDTYDPAAAPRMLKLLHDENLDMVTAVRASAWDTAYPPGHRIGNQALSAIVRGVFGGRISDVLSGYRAFSRRFVKSFPGLAGGFETETEFSVHALRLEMPIGEIVADYRPRPTGSRSKLRTWSDGARILRTILVLMKEGRPLLFFAVIGGGLLLASLVVGGPAAAQFLDTGLVTRLPSAALAVGMVMLSSLTLVCGMVLDSVERGRKEMKRLAYLAILASQAPHD